ncbi:3-hydroxy-3-methylglutaryl-coenzyme A reductase [Malaya genurostris]|uniref:3-hydroxy-3-methylglutaryl-coenzyme A reductase n=1 Tax=Malaya genurostris TaxID=325434 RepID=UPI0026F3881B|nr:3-hydroxy-3-methylglutaryl-coenzyme A reductase [Malaya genurostris]XP_058467199.1 3-hydroxy-3-methylglutaryl-coenzyme A reductase [Malaya genurostris]
MRVGRLFRAHGEFCASHPWEVIVALVTLTACIITFDKGSADPFQQNVRSSAGRPCPSWRLGSVGSGSVFRCDDLEQNGIDVILMTIVRCSAILYCYYHFCNLQKLGSKYILGIAGLFTVFSSFIFTSTVINFLGSEVSDLKDALFFFLLLIDLSKAGILAQLALCGSSQLEVTTNIARGMEILGPAISLDTLVETLVIGVGTLSGVQRLELLSGFAVLSAIVNYIVFMTFYPACLSLILDLSRNAGNLIQKNKKENLLARVLTEEDQKPNPVVQRVKLIMSSGLMIVHVLSRLTISEKDSDTAEQIIASHSHEHLAALNKTETNEISEFIIRWLSISTEQIVTYILIIALGVKFVFFDRHNLSDQILLSVANEAAAAAARRQKQLALSAEVQQLEAQTSAIRQQEKQPVATFTLAEIVPVAEKATQSELSLMSGRRLRTKSMGADDELDLDDLDDELVEQEPRPLEMCLNILNKSEEGAADLTDEEIKMIVRAGNGHCPLYKIESIIGDAERGVKIRRDLIQKEANLPVNAFKHLSYKNYDYSKVMNVCCENVLGYVQIPVGYAGPLTLDGARFYVPMATTEGALVASTNRGCKAISCRGVTSFVEDIGMTRAPCVKFPNVLRAAQAKRWIETAENFATIKKAFDSTSRFARLQECHIAMDGPVLYTRFRALTGDAMGMNMVSKGSEMALREVQRAFPDMQIISLSGNFCSDKKPAAINWIKGRGKRVVCETIVPADKLRSILKTNSRTLVQCNRLKNMTGSAVAGSIGGNNAHAANMVTAIYIATGQDPAQNVTSSNCSTNMECWGENGDDLYMTCTMPSLEVGTVGGGTGLPGQGTCLDMLGVRGAHPTHPAENSKQLARVICATVMAGELSLMAALVNSDLVKSHMRHNRSSVAMNPGLTAVPFTTSSSSNSLSTNTTSAVMH